MRSDLSFIKKDLKASVHSRWLNVPVNQEFNLICKEKVFVKSLSI